AREGAPLPRARSGRAAGSRGAGPLLRGRLRPRLRHLRRGRARPPRAPARGPRAVKRRVREELARALGSAVRDVRPIGGGDINDAWRVETDAGAVFVKTNDGADPEMFVREAE